MHDRPLQEISHGLNSAHLPQIASRLVNFERFTAGRLSYIPGIVQLDESPAEPGVYSGEIITLRHQKPICIEKKNGRTLTLNVVHGPKAGHF